MREGPAGINPPALLLFGGIRTPHSPEGSRPPDQMARSSLGKGIFLTRTPVAA